MIESIRIYNFRCLRMEKAIALRPLTVLVGPNDSGKSAFLWALASLARISGLQPSDSWRQKEGPTIEARINGKSYTLGMVAPELQPSSLYQLPSAGVPMESSGVEESVGIPALARDGSNLPAILDSVLRTDRKRFEEIVAAIAERVQGFEDIKIPTPEASKRRIEFVIENGLTIPGSAASTGVRTIVFFVTLAHLPNPPKLILLEEPETGVHPKRLEDIVGLLRNVTEGRHGECAQVVLTTHSPYLLDHIDLDRDQVLVFRRRNDGSRAPAAVDREGLRAFLNEFMLGEIWFNRGEEGLLEAKALSGFSSSVTATVTRSPCRT